MFFMYFFKYTLILLNYELKHSSNNVTAIMFFNIPNFRDWFSCWGTVFQTIFFINSTNTHPYDSYFYHGKIIIAVLKDRLPDYTEFLLTRQQEKTLNLNLRSYFCILSEPCFFSFLLKNNYYERTTLYLFIIISHHKDYPTLLWDTYINYTT